MNLKSTYTCMSVMLVNCVLTCVFMQSARTISINLYFFLIGYSQPLLTSAIEMDEFVCPFTHFMFYCNVSGAHFVMVLR